MKIVTSFIAMICMSAHAVSATIYVPDDYATIQGAIDASTNGDTIIVRPGTYLETIDFIGKAIHLKSESGAAATIIDAKRKGKVVKFKNGEGADSVLEGFTVMNGDSVGSGGGIRCYYSSPTITNNIITENRTQVNGGGIYCEVSSPAIIDNTITWNIADDHGGGIYCQASSPVITGNTITKNFKSGIRCYRSSPATIIGNTITDNFGCGIYCEGSSPTVVDNEIARNEGIGIYCIGCSSTIANNRIAENAAGISCRYSSPTIIDNDIIRNSFLFSDGGGIYCERSSPTIIRNNISWNEAGDRGGGIYCYYSSPAITNNNIARNKAAKGGGIFCSSHSSPAISHNNISSNTADGYGGGGIYCYNSSQTITNNTITGNKAIGNGGGIYFYSAHSIIANNTIAWNWASNVGGGIYCKSSSPVILNSILWNDRAPTDPEIYILSGSLVVRFSNVMGGWPGLGNIDADPLFVAPLENDFHLTWGSPCRNAGYNHHQLPAKDFEGDPRIRLGRVDIGADEFSHHLYQVGDTLPGNQTSVRVIGPPGAWVILGNGTAIQDPPYQSPFGPIHIARPWTTYNFGLIPSDGVLRVPATVPGNWVPSDKHYFQALVSNSIAMATNLMVVEVE